MHVKPVTPSGLLPHGSPAKQVDSDEDAYPGTTAPLLLHYESGHSSPINQARAMKEDHLQFEMEAERIRRIRTAQFCLGIFIFLSFLPTLMIFSFVSPVLVLLGIVGAVRYSSRLSRMSTRAFALLMFFNLIVVVFLDVALFGDGGYWRFPLVLAILTSAGVYYWHKQWKILGESEGQDAANSMEQKQLFFAYLETVKSVAQQVQKGNPSSQALELREFHSSAPTEGFYKGTTVLPIKSKVQVGNTSPSHQAGTPQRQKKENQKVDECQLFLLFRPKDSGWWIRGARVDQDCTSVQSIILEGFLSPTYEVYWTEETVDGSENTLYYGKFDNKGSFEGEWLSFTGNQSHQYSMAIESPAHPEHHLGLSCSNCQHNPHPGKCFLTKTHPQLQYCETCTANNPNLVQEGNCFELVLPEVNRGDQSYCPPSNP